MYEPNSWENLVIDVSGKFSRWLKGCTRDDAFGAATEIAQELAATVSERDMPSLLICCPALLTRQPEFYTDIVANAEHASVCAAECVRFNVKEFLERYLEEFWLENQEGK